MHKWLFVCRLNVYISLRVSPAASWAHGSPGAETGASGTPRGLTALSRGQADRAAGSASLLAGGERGERPHLWSLGPALSPLPPACPESVCPRLSDGQQGNTAHRQGTGRRGPPGLGVGSPSQPSQGPGGPPGPVPPPCPRPHPTDGDMGAQRWGWYLIRNPGLLPAQWTVSPEAWEVGCLLPLHPNLAPPHPQLRTCVAGGDWPAPQRYCCKCDVLSAGHCARPSRSF